MALRPTVTHPPRPLYSARAEAAPTATAVATDGSLAASKAEFKYMFPQTYHIEAIATLRHASFVSTEQGKDLA